MEHIESISSFAKKSSCLVSLEKDEKRLKNEANFFWGLVSSHSLSASFSSAFVREDEPAAFNLRFLPDGR